MRRRFKRSFSRAVRRYSFNMRSLSRDPEVIPVIVEVDNGDGTYQVRRDNWPGTIRVPVIPIGVRIPVPSRAEMRYEEGKRSRAFIWWPEVRRKRNPTIAGGFVDLFTGWIRQGAEALGRYFLSTLDDPADPNTSVLFGAMQALPYSPGHIVRTEGGRRYIADGQELREEDESTNAIVAGPTDLGEEILSTHVDGSSTRSIVGTFTPAVDCDDVFDDAFLDANDDPQIFADGQAACLFMLDYNTELAASLAAWLVANPNPNPGVCDAQYQAGAEAGGLFQFNDGYEDSGDCTVP